MFIFIYIYIINSARKFNPGTVTYKMLVAMRVLIII